MRRAIIRNVRQTVREWLPRILSIVKGERFEVQPDTYLTLPDVLDVTLQPNADGSLDVLLNNPAQLDAIRGLWGIKANFPGTITLVKGMSAAGAELVIQGLPDVMLEFQDD